MSSRDAPIAQTRRAEHAVETRDALVATARKIFAAKGYALSSLEEIVAAARLTKGALYHHFASKAALMEAVYRQMEQELQASVQLAAASASGDAGQRAVAALDAFLEASAAPEYVQIVLRDAPSVLGMREIRAIDQELGLGLVEALLRELMRGRRGRLALTATARVFFAAINEVAVSMAFADDPVRARTEGRAAVLAMLEGLRGVR